MTDAQIQQIFPDVSTPIEIEAINASITKMIHQYCNTTFEVLTYTGEVYNSKYRIVPEHRPIVSVTSLRDNGLPLIEGVDFYVYPDHIFLVAPSEVRKGVIISYSAGFSEVPEMVKRVALDLANYRAFKDSEGSRLFYRSQVFEEREYQVDPDLNELKILSRLKRWCQPRTSSRGGGSIRVGVM